jgi:ribonuclease HII
MASLIHAEGLAGADEAGRGPLAGPVVAACVILPVTFDIAGLNDSKKLTAAQREALNVRIRRDCRYSIELSSPEEIDRLNILHASLAAMASAIRQLNPSKVYVDGNQRPKGLSCDIETVVKGDGIYACIAAASVIAKVERDRIMCEYANEYPEYGFDRHFGYPTPEHFIALDRFGPCPIHRRSFGPVRDREQACLTFDE